jgi:hypothetical protein
MTPGDFTRKSRRMGLYKACVGQQAVALLLRMSQQPLTVQMRRRKDRGSSMELDTGKDVKPAVLGALTRHNLTQLSADRTSYIITPGGVQYLQKLADARLASPEALGIT